MLYLCCLFAPEKDFSTDKLDYYARNSEWIAAPTKEEAIMEYRKRYPVLNKWRAIDDIKILAELSRLLNNVKDGENGYLIAKKAMMSHLEANHKD